MLRTLPLLLLVACGGARPAATSGPTAPANHVDAPASPPVAVALVFNANEVWIGNDDLTPDDDPSRFLGALKGLELALDGADLANRLPTGSIGTAITYGDRAEVLVPMGAVDKLRGAALGTQKDYYKKTGTSLVSGIELAQLELDKTSAARKVMIVVGDGNDTDNAAAKPRLHALKAQLAGSHTQVFAIIYKGQLSDPTNTIATLVPDPRSTNSANDLPVAFAKVIHDCCMP